VRERRQIRGYGLVWELKAQVQSVPGKHGNVPLWFPVAVVSICYFLTVVMVVAILRHLWLVGRVAGQPPWLVAYVAFPGMCAFLLTTLEPHGRPAARHLASVVLDRVTPRERYLGRPVRPTGQSAVIDGVTAIARTPASATLPHGRVAGPRVIDFPEPVAVLPTRRARRFVAQPAGASPGWPLVTHVELDDGERLTIKP
jgi:hypothetical protein